MGEPAFLMITWFVFVFVFVFVFIFAFVFVFVFISRLYVRGSQLGLACHQYVSLTHPCAWVLLLLLIIIIRHHDVIPQSLAWTTCEITLVALEFQKLSGRYLKPKRDRQGGRILSQTRLSGATWASWADTNKTLCLFSVLCPVSSVHSPLTPTQYHGRHQ